MTGTPGKCQRPGTGKPAAWIQPTRQAGDCVVFDSTRILHARTAFAATGRRHLQGCYANLDGVASTSTHTFNGRTTTETFLFGSDGSLTMPLTSIGSTTVRVKSGGIVWPSQAVIDSGQPTKGTIVVVASIAGQNHTLTAHVTVQGEGSATVTVPAGTYHATVVKDTVSESIAGITVSVGTRNWLAPGVGPVKSEVTTNGTVVSGEELTSFTKG
jgi:DUF3108-like/Taurine catabolism dioxygenase TauD, TfdA family